MSVASVVSGPGSVRSLSVLLLALTGLSWSGPVGAPENQRRASVGRDAGDSPLLDAQDFVRQILSTLNLTEPGPGPLGARQEPPQYMLELYKRFANDRSSVPSASIVRSFKNEDSSPYSSTPGGVRIFPLLFNVSLPQHERLTAARLRLFTRFRRARRPHPGPDCQVTVYNVHGGVVWTKEVGKEGRGREREEVAQMKDLEEVVTKRLRARDNGWVSFDLTHVAARWQKSGRAARRLEVHVSVPGRAGVRRGVAAEAGASAEIDRSREGKENAVMIVFSDDKSRDGKREKRELARMMEHEDELGRSQRAPRGHVDQGRGDDGGARVRRGAKSESSCRRWPLFVDFKEIKWDAWIIQPLGYEAYECSGVCLPPMTAEVSPTKHAIVQTLLSMKSPEKASRACCVPTKLEPISLLYLDNGVPTFNHKYEGMVVAECGCR